MSFVRWKFNRMLAVATVVMAVNYVVMLSGSVIVGNLVGPDGLAGLNVCTPVFGAASFLASILSVGTGLVFSRAMGAFDARRAAGVFSQSMLLAAGIGVLIYVTMAAGESIFLDVTGVTGAVREQAEDYWRWQAVALALLPAVLTMEALVFADGDGTVATLAGAVHVSGVVGLSVFLTNRLGHAGGVSLGTALAMVGVLAVCCLHFLRQDNHLRPVCSFSAADLRETVAASLADSTIYLCWGALIFVVNRFALAQYGQYLLPVVALAASVVEFSIVFDGVGEAIIPLGGMYDGEGNRPALRTLANHSALVATLEGLVCGIVSFAFAPTLAQGYGFDPADIKIFETATDAIRILAFAMPFMGLLMMMNTHYLVVHHIPFAVSVTVMKDFVCPCAGVLLLGWPGSHWGQWIWVGFTAGYLVAAAYPFLFVLLRHGRGLFPWLIERDDGRSANFAVRLSGRVRGGLRERVGTFVAGCGVSREVVAQVAERISAEEERARASLPSAVWVEAFVSVGASGDVRLVIRDTGLRPLSDAAATRVLNTLNCNRAEYRFGRR